MSSDNYSMSFTTGGLFIRESLVLTKMYLGFGDWDLTRDKAIEDNQLQVRTISSRKRLFREISARLKTFSNAEIEFFLESSPQDQAYLLWLAVCRRYTFIADFSVEVLRERYITLKNDLTYEDFDSFFNRKSEWHLELDKIAPSTRNKLRQVLFKMLREADLLMANNMIQAAMLSPRLFELIHQSNHREILYFPVFDSELKGMA
jgi:hypothetical protein